MPQWPPKTGPQQAADRRGKPEAAARRRQASLRATDEAQAPQGETALQQRDASARPGHFRKPRDPPVLDVRHECGRRVLAIVWAGLCQGHGRRSWSQTPERAALALRHWPWFALLIAIGSSCRWAFWGWFY